METDECVRSMGVFGLKWKYCHPDPMDVVVGLVPLCDIKNCDACNADYTACEVCKEGFVPVI